MNVQALPGRVVALAAICILSLAGCAGLVGSAPGVLQPQTVAGSCQVTKFYLLAQTAVHTQMVVDNTGQPCTFTVLNPDIQAFPSASLITEQAAHGSAVSGFANSGRSPMVSYTPQPGYVGPDRFTLTIEPNDHAVAVAVTVR